ncbi:hypothetical protein ABTN00_20585, partial [Acinetobacter baumannii]
MRSRPDQNPAQLPAAEPRLWWTQIDRIAGRLTRGRLTVVLPGGQTRSYVGAGDGPQALVHLRRWRGLLRVLVSGDI